MASENQVLTIFFSLINVPKMSLGRRRIWRWM